MNLCTYTCKNGNYIFCVKGRQVNFYLLIKIIDHCVRILYIFIYFCGLILSKARKANRIFAFQNTLCKYISNVFGCVVIHLIHMHDCDTSIDILS